MQCFKADSRRNRESDQTHYCNMTNTGIKKLPINRSPGLDKFPGEYCQTPKQELMSTFLKQVQKLKRKECFRTHSTRPALL